MEQLPRTETRGELSIKFGIHVAANVIASAPVDSQLNSYCEVDLQTYPNKVWVPLGKTEVILETHEPRWIESFHLDYKFESMQYLRFNVFDEEVEGRKIVGTAKVALGQVIKNPHIELDLIHRPTGQTAGQLILIGEEDVISKQNVVLLVKGLNLEDKDTFSKSDPFFRLYRQANNGEWIIVYESEVIQDNLNPEWAPLMMSMSDLCRCDLDTSMKLECYDYDDDAEKELIGLCMMTARDMLRRGTVWDLINPKKLGTKKYVNSGQIVNEEVQITEAESFVDYIKSGIALNLTVAVDYTASNGLVSNLNSLHYLNADPNKKNEYESAIIAMHRILSVYDDDKRHPLFGFGGVPNWMSETSHCFAINKTEADPYVVGLEGLLDTYHRSLAEIKLDGPTKFHELIARAKSMVESDSGKTYHVLLILTDGEVHDIKETIDVIVAASGLPLSIVIVGIGHDEFTNLVILDADKLGLKDSAGRKAVRDIVQFVPFRKFRSEPDLLAKEALAEIPRQVLSYFKQTGVRINK